MSADLRRRLEAVERAVTDGHTDLPALDEAADVADRLATLETRIERVETRLDDLDATTQALRGYLGGVEGASAAVERRADLALSKAEAVEAAVFDDEGLAVERLPTDSRASQRVGTDESGDGGEASESDDSSARPSQGRSLAARVRDAL